MLPDNPEAVSAIHKANRIALPHTEGMACQSETAKSQIISSQGEAIMHTCSGKAALMRSTTLG